MHTYCACIKQDQVPPRRRAPLSMHTSHFPTALRHSWNGFIRQSMSTTGATAKNEAPRAQPSTADLPRKSSSSDDLFLDALESELEVVPESGLDGDSESDKTQDVLASNIKPKKDHDVSVGAISVQDKDPLGTNDSANVALSNTPSNDRSEPEQALSKASQQNTAEQPVPKDPAVEKSIPPMQSLPAESSEPKLLSSQQKSDFSFERPSAPLTGGMRVPPLHAFPQKQPSLKYPVTLPGSSFEIDGGEHASEKIVIQYEILPGLFAQMSDDAVVSLHDVDGYTHHDGERKHFDLLVSAKKVSLGLGSFLLGKDIAGDGYFLTAQDVMLQGQLMRPNEVGDQWDMTVRNLDISTKGLVLDPNQDQKKIQDFLSKFGYTSADSDLSGDAGDTPESHPMPLPTRRLSREEWEHFLKNARDDKRGNASPVKTHADEGESSLDQNQSPSSQVDFMIPNVRVQPVTCKVTTENALEFPECEGTADCTVRTLLEYYCRSILQSMRETSPNDGDGNGSSTTLSDITSIKGSLMGAAAGAAVLGPVGFLAGSYLGGQMGRKHSSSVLGASAGAALFGPVGLIAGACYGESTRSVNLLEGTIEGPKPYFGSVAMEEETKKITERAVEHLSSNKYEYAGTTGVTAGATAGSVLGPVGMIAGAVIGSISARNAVESVSDPSTSASAERGSYRFGDISRSVVARGKKSRGSDTKDGYQFGDFTRGLLNRGKGN